MKEGKFFGTKIPSLEINRDAYISHIDGQWSLQLSGTDEKILIPERLGKVLSLGIQITNDAVDRDKNKERLAAFDCHTLVLLAFGLCTVQQALNSPSQEISMFDVEYQPIETSREFDALVRQKLTNENVGVLQINNGEGDVSHSAFVFKTATKIYIAEKAGYEGIVVFNDSSAHLPGMLKAYGQLVGVEGYSVLFEKYAKKT